MQRVLLTSLPFALSLALVGTACSPPDAQDKGLSGGTGGESATNQDPNNPGGDGDDSSIELPIDQPVEVVTDRDVDVREKVCDDQGNCTCLRMALLGTLDSAANDKDTQPFIDWLNNNSDGTATVEMISTKPTLDAAWLANYDILLVANVNGWSFSPEEKAAVATWSKETGGGIVSLTGFISENAEEVATSQLIEFSGIKYTSTFSAENGQSMDVPYNGRQIKKYCIGDGANITTPISFTPLEGDFSGLTHELQTTGAFIGYTIDAPADAVVVANDPATSQPIAVAKQVDNAGRVFAWGDEWIIFASQWESEPNNPNQADQYNDCYELPVGNPREDGYQEGFIHTVASLYQTKQFWYNVINWVAPPSECGFTIEDDDVVVIVK